MQEDIEPPATMDIGRKRWLMLALGTTAQTAACVFVYGVPYLVPALRTEDHLSLAQAGGVIAAPTLGLVVALVAWGAAADHYGERVVLLSGLTLSALALLAGVFVHGPMPLGVTFFLAGAAGASVYAASGRVVMGWFDHRRRGLAMGVRQTSTPLGMGIAALSVPLLADRWGVRGVLLFTTVLTGAVALAVALYVSDPPRPARPATNAFTGKPASPYRTPALWRIHGASALLVWPQFTISAFGLVFLIDALGWSPAGAGRLMALGQLLGAMARIGAGTWSDRVGSRLRPMRRLATATAALTALLALCAHWPSWPAAVVLVVACGLAGSTNGLSFTSTAELAGPHWAGRALGVQNTGQNLIASLTPPLAGALIGTSHYAAAFALATAVAAVALLAVPAGRRPATRPPGPTGTHSGSRPGPPAGSCPG
ncbi:MFS transporter [Streptomyces sp. LP05-1]|uniref:MFS transporter n=1 Tax=Streptomyces pyxinae TaxID=2970734 RepID=A0ABT2CH97_9ACTN|nr:MFS transporter [Streptomyces sp. LP05-1]MCS0636675.1 MFS transporter [Streptomyces sp. LP05-1]